MKSVIIYTALDILCTLNIILKRDDLFKAVRGVKKKQIRGFIIEKSFRKAVIN